MVSPDAVLTGDGLAVYHLDPVLLQPVQERQRFTGLAFDGLEEHIVNATLKELEAQYGERFIRIHRGYLVNCKHIDRLEYDVLGRVRLWLKGYDQPLPVSRRLAARVRAAMHC